MTHVSTCSTAEARGNRSACRATVGTMLCAWSRFIRLRQARHVYFDVAPQRNHYPANDNSRES